MVSGTEQIDQAAERAEYGRLYAAGDFASCRLIALRVLAGPCADRARWVYKLGCALYELGSLLEAYSVYLTNAHLLDDCADHYVAGNYLLNFGAVAKALGPAHFDQSLHSYEQAAGRYRLAGLTSKQGFVLNNIGALLISTGYPERAHEHLDAAYSLFDESNELARCAEVDDTRAIAYEAEGNLGGAFDCSYRAVRALLPLAGVEAAALAKACETHERILAKLKPAT